MFYKVSSVGLVQQTLVKKKLLCSRKARGGGKNVLVGDGGSLTAYRQTLDLTHSNRVSPIILHYCHRCTRKKIFSLPNKTENRKQNKHPTLFLVDAHHGTTIEHYDAPFVTIVVATIDNNNNMGMHRCLGHSRSIRRWISNDCLQC